MICVDMCMCSFHRKPICSISGQAPPQTQEIKLFRTQVKSFCEGHCSTGEGSSHEGAMQVPVLGLYLDLSRQRYPVGLTESRNLFLELKAFGTNLVKVIPQHTCTPFLCPHSTHSLLAFSVNPDPVIHPKRDHIYVVSWYPASGNMKKCSVEPLILALGAPLEH